MSRAQMLRQCYACRHYFRTTNFVKTYHCPGCTHESSNPKDKPGVTRARVNGPTPRDAQGIPIVVTEEKAQV